MNLSDTARFFIVYPLNLEDLGKTELEVKFLSHFPESTLTILEKSAGGLEIECPLFAGLTLNKILRTPTRILLRIGEFKCRDAPKLFLKMSKFNWGPWMIGQTPEVESSAINSRLFDSRKIEKAIQDGVVKHYKHQPVKKKYLEHLALTNTTLLPKIYYRAVDDFCTISLDTTGERLHMRGEKILTGLAPIRESLASLLLLQLKKEMNPKFAYTLIDPMCGSGTFLLEASQENAITSARDFSYFHIPVVLDNLLSMEKTPLKIDDTQSFSKLLGFERNPEVLAQARKNALGKKIVLESADLFEKKSNEDYQFEHAAVILNPPYGIRVGDKSDINLAYYLKVIELIKNKYNPELVGIIVPAEYIVKSNSTFNILSARAFKNGGIEVVFYVLGFK